MSVNKNSNDKLNDDVLVGQSSGSKFGISRRAFVTCAATALGSLFLEPVVGEKNTFWMPGAKNVAYADETMKINVPAGKFCVVVYDAEKGKTSTVSDVTVHIKSLYNQKESEVKTDDKGCAFFDMKDLAKTTKSDQIGDYLEFDACITLTKSGNREVVIPRMHIIDSLAMQAPTRALDDKPYFREISFDGWDIQYNDQEFTSSPANDVSHDLVAELYFPSAGKYSILPIISKSNTSSRVNSSIADAQTIEAAAGEFKKVTFTKEFLKATGNDALQEGDSFSLIINDPNKSGDDAKLFTIATGLCIFRAPINQGNATGDGCLSPYSSDYFNSSSLTTSDDGGSSTSLSADTDGLRKPDSLVVPLPEGLPGFLSKANFNCWMPSAPIMFRYDPAGYFIFGLDIECFRYSNAPDADTGDTSWRSQPRGSIATQTEAKIKSFKTAIQGYKDMNALRKANGKKTASKATSVVTVDVSFQAFADLAYKKDKKLWDGDFEFIFGAQITGTKTWQKMAWCIPYYIEVSLTGGLTFGMHFGLQSNPEGVTPDQYLDSIAYIFKNLKFTPDKSLMLAFNLGVSASLCVGIAKVVGAGVRGSGGLSLAFQWRMKTDPLYGKKRDPRIRFGGNAEFAIVAQFLFFKKSWTIAHGSWPDIYDSDKKSKASLSSNENSGMIESALSNIQKGGEYYLSQNDQAKLLAGSDDITPADFVIVTDAEMQAIAEIVASTSTAVTAALAASNSASTLSNEDLSVEGKKASSFAFETMNDFVSSGRKVSAKEIASGSFETPATHKDSSGAISLMVDSSNDPYYNYTWTSGHEASFKDRGSGSDVIYKMGKEGVRPRHMNKLASNIYSAPNSKLIEVAGSRYLFRIAPVVYDGKSRPRVVYQKITESSVSQPFPVEYSTIEADAGAHADFLDYNFDVKIINKDSASPKVLVMIVSGERKDGDSISIYDAAEATVISVVKLALRSSASVETSSLSTDAQQGDFVSASSKTWQSPSYDDAGVYYSYSAPQLHVRDENTKAVLDSLDQDGYDHEFGYFVMTAAASKADLMTPGTCETGMGIIHFALKDDADEYDALSVAMQSGTIKLIPNSLQFDPSNNNVIYGTLGYLTTEGVGVDALKMTFEANKAGRKQMSAASVFPIIDEDKKVKMLSPWGGINEILASVSTKEDINVDESFGYLALVELPKIAEIVAHDEASEGFATFTMNCISPQNVPLGGMHFRANHKYCYFATNHTGAKGYDYDEEDTATPHVEDPTYFINAICEVDGVLTDSFVFAEADNAIDSFFALEDTDSSTHNYTSFATCHITELDSSKSDLWAFDVPFLRCIATDSLAPMSDTIVAGQPTKFTVTLTNNGNTVLTQAILQLSDADKGTALGEFVLNFDEATNASQDGLYKDIYYLDAMTDEAKNNILVKDNGDAALIPGQSRSFVIEITIPSDWEGTKKITANAPTSLISFVDPGTGQIVSDSANVADYDSTENNAFTAELEVDPGGDYDMNKDMNPGDLDPADGDDGDESGDGSGSSGDGDAASPSMLAKTGDGQNGVMGAALTAAGLAGLGFAAYSARRSKLEREAAGLDDDAEIIENSKLDETQNESDNENS